MSKPPAPPYIPAKHTGGRQDRIDRIVMHGTVSNTECGGALAIARYFLNPSYVSSAHYVVDPCNEYQCVYDHTIAWHDGTNTNSIGVELCDLVEGPLERWDGAEHSAMLERAADLVRQLCEAYGIAKRKLTPAQIRAGEKGICGHDDMRDAFPGSTSHWDPGAFPWDRFIALINNTSDTEEPFMSLTPMPAGGKLRPGGADELAYTSLSVPLVDRERELVVAPGTGGSAGVHIDTINTWKTITADQAEQRWGASVTRPGGFGSLGKDMWVHRHTSLRLVIPPGVGKIDIVYASDTAWSLALAPL